MALVVNKYGSVKELTKEALLFAKYNSDVDAIVYVNGILEELKFKMSSGNFIVFKEKINTIINA